MNRTGLIAVLAVATIAGLLLGVFPALDLRVSEWFFNPGPRLFAVTQVGIDNAVWIFLARDVGMWVVAALAAPAVVALLGKVVFPRTAMVLPGRVAVYLVLTLVLAPGVMANSLLKDHWGRSRPIDVSAFSGTERFVPWWDPRGDCPQNCSFVSGEAAGAFWALAPASLAPGHLRPLAYGAAMLFGTAVGMLRVAYGGHFFSDVVFAGVFTFLIVWLVHAALFRATAPWLSDKAIEGAIERLVAPLHRRRSTAASGTQ